MVHQIIMQINFILLNVFQFNEEQITLFNKKLYDLNKQMSKLKGDINLILYDFFNFGLDKLKIFNSKIKNLEFEK